MLSSPKKIHVALFFPAFVLLSVLTVHAQTCAPTSGSYKFRRIGETIGIPLKPARSAERADVDCEPVALELRWSNGRNNGSNLQLTFHDSSGQPIYAKQVSAFMYGTKHFPLSGTELQVGRGSMISSPVEISLRAIPPFALPASVSFTISWSESRRRESDGGETEPASSTSAETPKKDEAGNEVLRMRTAVRLIGSSRVPLVQIELKTSRPFPVKDAALQLRIGKRVFLNELSGDHTGRRLMLSLTPQMFEELEDGAEIVAFFDEHDSWSFGKLQKGQLDK